MTAETTAWLVRALGWFLAVLLLGCQATPGTSRLVGLYASKFGNVEIPRERILESGRRMPLRKLDDEAEVWKATILVVMQRAPIVWADRERGVVLAPPYGVVIAGSPAAIHVLFQRDLFDSIEPGSPSEVEISEHQAGRAMEVVLEKIVTQLRASQKLRAGSGAWSYLND